jgi:hypothetical protein
VLGIRRTRIIFELQRRYLNTYRSNRDQIVQVRSGTLRDAILNVPANLEH